MASDQGHETDRFRNGNENATTGIAQNANLTTHMLFDLRQARRRINGYRYGARIEYAEECGEEVGAGRQHECDAVTRHYVPNDKTGCDVASRLGKLGVGDRAEDGVFVFEYCRMQTIGMPRHVPIEHFSQRLGVGSRRNQREGDRRRHGHLRRAPTGCPLLYGSEQVADCLGFRYRAGRQADPEGAFNSEKELGPAKAIDTQVPVERVLQRDIIGAWALRMQLANKITHQIRQILGL